MPYVAPTQLSINTSLNAHNLGGTPAAAIVGRVGHELWRGTNTSSLTALIRALCRNFYHYGRNNGWRWGAFNGNQLPGVADSNGYPLISDPLFVQTNCGGFNAAVRQVASKVLGVGSDLLDGSSCADGFATRPGTVGIDAGWAGNVRTIDSDFAALGCYAFVNHSWCRDVTTGVMYDASTNTLDFQQKTDLMWATFKRFGTGELQTFDQVHNAVALTGEAPYVKARIGYLQANLAQFPNAGRLTRAFVAGLPTHNDPGRYWPASLICSVYELPQAMRHANGIY